MSVKITDNTTLLIFKNENAISLALRYMLDGIDEKAFPRTPKDKGNLRKDVLKQVIGRRAVIAWNKKYAIYQEKKQFKNYTTPGTGPHFAENAVKSVTSNAESYLRKARAIL